MKHTMSFDFKVGEKVYIYQAPTRADRTIVDCVIHDYIERIVVDEKTSYNKGDVETYTVYRLLSNNYGPEFRRSEDICEDMETALRRWLPVFEKEIARLKAQVDNSAKMTADRLWAEIKGQPEVLNYIKLLVKLESKKK